MVTIFLLHYQSVKGKVFGSFSVCAYVYMCVCACVDERLASDDRCVLQSLSIALHLMY